MNKNIFSNAGYLIYRFRIALIIFWIFSILVCAPFIPHLMEPFKSTGFVAENAESTITQQFLNDNLKYNQKNRFLVVYHSPDLKITNTLYQKKIKQSLADMKDFPLPHEIIYPMESPQQVSKNKHSAYAVILFKNTEPLTANLLKQLKERIKTPKNIRMEIGGEQIFTEGINKQTQEDLYRADAIAAPLTSVILILIFGSLVATLVPVCLGGGCALIILTTLFFLGHFFTLSIFTLNLALLLGLCLSLDYSLFIIYRFRNELRLQKSPKEAIAMTMSTAGRAVFFSGLAVFISLSALLLFPINILFSIGVGGLIAVFFAVMIATTLLPALLSVLKHDINRFSLRRFDNKQSKNQSIWHKVAKIVVERPWFFFFLSLSFLLLLGYSFINVKFGVSDFKIVPKHSESREFFDEFKKYFDENELTPIVLVVSTKQSSILSSNNISKLYHLTHKLEKNDNIKRIDSLVNTTPRLSKKQYQRLYQAPTKELERSGVKQLLDTSTGKQFALIHVVTKTGANSKETKALIKSLKIMDPGKNLTLKVTGVPVQNIDVLHAIAEVFPYAVLWIMALTYLVLLVLLRSLFLPLKAIFMTTLSLVACYGVLVFIFQEGHLHQLLNFEPQGILDVTLIIIIFCALFGFSMDYEVFLLSRIQEHFKKTHNNKLSIIFGIEQSNRIITSAALIVICICGSFMTADVLMVKEFGLGIAVAIAVDAFIIRSVLVPATMTLLTSWNWYLPKWLDKLLP